MTAQLSSPTSRRGKRFSQLVEEAQTRIEELSVGELKQWIKAKPDLVVLDVREPTETAQGTIPQALTIPRGVLEAQIDRLVPDQDSLIVAYCAGGNRSALAADTLQTMGYTQVYSLIGGWNAWIND